MPRTRDWPLTAGDDNDNDGSSAVDTWVALLKPSLAFLLQLLPSDTTLRKIGEYLERFQHKAGDADTIDFGQPGTQDATDQTTLTHSQYRSKRGGVASLDSQATQTVTWAATMKLPMNDFGFLDPGSFMAAYERAGRM